MGIRGFLTIVALALLSLGAAYTVQPQPLVLKAERTWESTIPAAAMPLTPPAVTAQSAFLCDAQTGQELYSVNPDEERPNASTTKIITATIAIQHGDLDRTVSVSKEAAGAEPANIDMKPGEKFTLKDLLYAMMIHSANDAAAAVAEAVSGKVSKFADEMNAEAAKLGCTHTHFVTPNGLQDPKHYTTARDLAKMTVYALKLPFFNELIKTKQRKIKRSMNQLNVVVHRSHGDKFLFTYPGADGVKTGFTHPAWRCYVGSATHQDDIGPRRLVTVVLHANDTLLDTTSLMDYGFNAWKRRRFVAEGEKEGSLQPPHGAPIPFHATTQFVQTLRADTPHTVHYHYAVRAAAPTPAGASVGILDVKVDEGTPEHIALILDRNLPTPEQWKEARAERWGFCAVALALMALGYGSFAKANRRRRILFAANR